MMMGPRAIATAFRSRVRVAVVQAPPRIGVALGILAKPRRSTAQAAETGTLTLACKGTAVEGYEGAEPNPISVNFTAGTVQDFGTPDLLGVRVKITGVNDLAITFGGTVNPSATNGACRGALIA
jgi:hypothetical protein